MHSNWLLFVPPFPQGLRLDGCPRYVALQENVEAWPEGMLFRVLQTAEDFQTEAANWWEHIRGAPSDDGIDITSGKNLFLLKSFKQFLLQTDTNTEFRMELIKHNQSTVILNPPPPPPANGAVAGNRSQDLPFRVGIWQY